MLTVNSDVLASYGLLKRQITGGATVYMADGSTVSLLPNDTLASMNIESNIPKGKFFGFTASKKLTIELVEKLPLTKGTKIKPFIKIVDATEVANMPFYYIDSVEIDDVNNKTIITAYDALYTASGLYIESLNINYPLTLKDFAETIVEALNCTLIADFTGVNPTLEQDTTNLDGTEDLATLLNAIAEATGTICICTGDDSITFKTLERTPSDTILPGTYFNFTSQEPLTLTKVASSTQLGDNYVTGTDEGLTQVIWDNPFIELREDVGTLLEAIADKVIGLSMMPYTLESRGNPFYEIGDCLSVLTALGEKTIYYFNETLAYGGGLKSNTSWVEGEQERVDANPTTLGETIKQTYAKVDKANKQIDMLVSEVEGNAAAISSLKINTDSIAASVSKMEASTNEGFESINNDIGTLTQQVEATLSAEDVRLEIKSELANGVDKVITNTGFVFNDEGLTISKTGSEMTTNIDEDGMSVSRGDIEVLTADNQGVIAYNLHAKTYLIVGETSRFEDYQKNGEQRTGCFWIGETEVDS